MWRVHKGHAQQVKLWKEYVVVCNQVPSLCFARENGEINEKQLQQQPQTCRVLYSADLMCYHHTNVP